MGNLEVSSRPGVTLLSEPLTLTAKSIAYVLFTPFALVTSYANVAILVSTSRAATKVKGVIEIYK
jgi:hypothetical protein